MTQMEKPDDFVIATGEMHSVREFVVAAFRHVGKEIEWLGVGQDEVGREKDTGSQPLLLRVFFYKFCNTSQIYSHF